MPLQTTPGAAVRETVLPTHWGLRAAALLAMLVVVVAVGWLVWNRSRSLPELKQQQLTENSMESAVESGAISPDGRYLAYSDVHGIHIKLIETGETQDIPQPESLNGQPVKWQIVSWFPAGTRFLANAGVWSGEDPLSKLTHPSIWIVSMMGGAPRKLRDEAYAWSVSPDGASVAFTANFGSARAAGGRSARVDRQVWLIDLNGAQPRELFDTDQGSDLSNVLWSPDGQRMAYVRNRQASAKVELSIEIRDLQGGAPSTVFHQPGPADRCGLHFCWLPSGRMIFALGVPSATSGPRCDFRELRIDPHTNKAEGNTRRITEWAGSCIDSLSATADGKQLAFRRWSLESGTYVANLKDNQTSLTDVRRLTLHNGEGATAWTADSRAVIFYRQSGLPGIFKQALEQNAAQPIVTGRGLWKFWVPRVSPDGAWVLYQANPKDDGSALRSTAWHIMRVPIGGGVPQPVLTASMVDCCAVRSRRAPRV